MSKEESDKNKQINEIISTCYHEPIKVAGTRGVICSVCGCRFAAVLLPVLSEFPTYDFEG